jgi:hypothetical protein
MVKLPWWNGNGLYGHRNYLLVRADSGGKRTVAIYPLIGTAN